MGIRSLTIQESERGAAHIFKRITDLELELAARDFAFSSAMATRGCPHRSNVDLYG